MKTKNQIKWEDLPREDLRNIPAMEKKGFEACFSYHDHKANRITASNVPHFPVNFKKGDKHIWSIRDGWQTADLTGNGDSVSIKYRNHKPYFMSLDEIIKTVL